MAESDATLSADREAVYECVLSWLSHEQDKLLVLAMNLRNNLEPADLKNPKDEEKLNEWLLAQCIVDRLESTRLLDSIRVFLMGEDNKTH